MAIGKKEFYEGAALYLLVRSGVVETLKYVPPFIEINGDVLTYLKYTTKAHSPWAFTFSEDEQTLLANTGKKKRIVLGLICGGDGVAALTYERFRTIAGSENASVHIACYRKHKEHYEVRGPAATLSGKVAPSSWYEIIGGQNEAS